MVLDPLHYLATLDQKPGVLEHAPVFRDWELPACFASFRAALEREYGATAGGRRYAKALQLLVDHPLARVGEAIEFCLRHDQISVESATRRVQVLAAIATPADVAQPVAGAAALPRVHVPLPDLSRFDQLLGGHDTNDMSYYNISVRQDVEQAAEMPVGVFFA
jgi:hypothetical protein